MQPKYNDGGVQVLRGGNKVNSRITTLDFRRADHFLLMDWPGRIPWEMSLKRRRAQESWGFFKAHLLQAEEQSFLMCRKSSLGGRRLVEVNKELPTEVKLNKEIYMR